MLINISEVRACPDDGGSTHLWNVVRHLLDYTAVHPRRLWTSYSPPWEPEISRVAIVQTFQLLAYHYTLWLCSKCKAPTLTLWACEASCRHYFPDLVELQVFERRYNTMYYMKDTLFQYLRALSWEMYSEWTDSRRGEVIFCQQNIVRKALKRNCALWDFKFSRRRVFWDVLPCKIIVDRRFRGAYCLHHPW
jgi:hypothetical protein